MKFCDADTVPVAEFGHHASVSIDFDENCILRGSFPPLPFREVPSSGGSVFHCFIAFFGVLLVSLHVTSTITTAFKLMRIIVVFHGVDISDCLRLAHFTSNIIRLFFEQVARSYALPSTMRYTLLRPLSASICRYFFVFIHFENTNYGSSIE